MTVYRLREIPEISRKEIMRYAGCKPAEELYSDILEECLRETEGQIAYRLCFCELPVERKNGICRIGNMSFYSKALSKCLGDCSTAVVFAATIGVGIDRLINKYCEILPSKALFFQAIGGERIEALCDAFCKEYPKKLTTRFSPGYGDLSLDVQRELIGCLNAQKLIGITLNDSLMMSPTKSVTAFAGIKE